jgi:hypothetical protein
VENLVLATGVHGVHAGSSVTSIVTGEVFREIASRRSSKNITGKADKTEEKKGGEGEDDAVLDGSGSATPSVSHASVTDTTPPDTPRHPFWRDFGMTQWDRTNSKIVSQLVHNALEAWARLHD